MVKPIFVAATRQHVGKTTTSLGLVQGFLERSLNVGFIKPVGQQHLLVNGVKVDKDVALMKKFFSLPHDIREMSPVLIPSGYTRKYIDGEIKLDEQIHAITRSYESIARTCDVVLLEGTGHTGVGSVVELNNAQVAAQLGAEMILVANGGLGSAFDELELNRIMCKEYRVPIMGVILNKVKPDKLEMVQEYFTKLMKRWNVPLLGVIPDEPFLGRASLADLEKLFGAELIAGERCRMRHYETSHTMMVAVEIGRFIEKIIDADNLNWTRPLFVTHVSRNDIILAFIAHSEKVKLQGKEYGGALILSGPTERHSLSDYVVDMIKTYDLPVLHAPSSTYEIMDLMHHFTPKLHQDDVMRSSTAAKHYKTFIDFDKLLK